MADNTAINAGSGGDTIATDELTGTINGSATSSPYPKAQRIKPGWGADGSITDVNTGTSALPVQGAGAAGSAVAGNPLLIAGTDGTNARGVLLDSSGRQIVVGAAAAGSAVAGNPVLIGGTDGTNARLAGVDSSNRLIVRVDSIAGGAIAVNQAGDSIATAVGLVAVGQPSLYNGGSWDRQRGNWNTTTGESGTKTASFVGNTQVNFNSPAAMIYVLCGTVSGVVPTFNVQLQWSPDSGTTWVNLGPASGNITTTGQSIALLVGPNNWSQAAGASPADLTTGASVTVALNARPPRNWRLNYAIGGTTPSFALTGVYVSYWAS